MASVTVVINAVRNREIGICTYIGLQGVLASCGYVIK